MYVESGDPVRESRRDIARYGGALLAAGLLLGPAIAAATHDARSDPTDPPGWVYVAGFALIVGIPGLALIGAVLTFVRPVRPLGQGILIGTAIAIAGTAALVAAIGFP